MPSFDASSALDNLLGNDGGYADGAGAAVATRTQILLDGPPLADSIDGVLQLAGRLPRLEDIRPVGEDDTSELTALETEQRERTEAVINTALAAGDAAVWVVAQAMERAAKGRWWRRTHRSLEEYVRERTGRSAVYVRQLRRDAPLALEIAEATGTVPKPSQVAVAARTHKAHGSDAAVQLVRFVQDVSAALGERPTAGALLAAHERLPKQLPEDAAARRETIERTVLRALGAADDPFESDSNGSDGIPSLPFDEKSNNAGGAPRTPTPPPEDDILDAEIVPEHLAALNDALRTLNGLNRTLSRDVFTQAAADPQAAEEYRKVRAALLHKLGALRNKILKTPNP